MKKNIQIISLFTLSMILGLFIIVHFPYTTNLIGWDALSPELNYSENFLRGVHSAWQENYGLGAMIGHGTGATLPHTILTFIINLFVPTKNVRATFHFLCFFLGGIGAYLLIQKIIQLIFKKELSDVLLIFSAIAGALYYAFNLGTLQLLFLPLEAFDAHFAFLPWVFWALLLFLHEKKNTHLVLFFILNILLSIQGFIPSLFIAYITAFSLVLLGFVLQEKQRSRTLQTAFLASMVVIITNSYWLPTFAHFTFFKNTDFLTAYNNQESTVNFIEKNQRFGTVFNVGTLRSFYLETNIDGNYIFESWYTYLQNPLTLMLYFTFFLIALIGLVIATVKKKYRAILMPFILVFCFFFLSLTTHTFPFSFFSKTLSHLSLYKHAFRTTFTKLGTGMALSISIFFSITFLWLHSFVAKKFKFLIILGSLVLIIALLIPQFLFTPYYKKLAVNIPAAYTEITNAINTETRSHVALLPMSCPEGWYNYTWGYVGSGFLWYQSKQPIIERFADIWSSKNEQYFWEMSFALNSNNPEAVQRVLSKYNIRWVIVDENIEHCQSTKGFEHQLKTIESTFSTENATQILVTNSGVKKPITLYEIPANATQDFISTSSVTLLSTNQKWSTTDELFSAFGPYVLDNTLTEHFVFPHLFSLRSKPLSLATLSNQDDMLTFSSSLTTDLDATKLVVDYSRDPVPFSISIVKNSNDEYIAELLLDFPDIRINNILHSKDTQLRLGSIIPSRNAEETAWFSNNKPLTNKKGMLDPLQETSLELRSRNNQPIFIWKSSEDNKLKNIFSIEKYQLTQKENLIQVQVNKDFQNSQSSVITDVLALKPYYCDHKSIATNATPRYEISTNPSFMRLLPKNRNICIQNQNNSLSTAASYIVEISSRISNPEQTRFKLSTANGSQIMNIGLPTNINLKSNYYLVPRTHNNTQYTYSIISKSIWTKQPFTDINSINFWQVPYYTLTSLSTSMETTPTVMEDSLTISSINRISNTLYKVKYTANKNGYINFFQAYDDQWVAISFPKIQIFQHTTLNRWANAWQVPAGTGTIYIIYLPQFYSYLGYGLFLLGCLLLFFLFL